MWCAGVWSAVWSLVTRPGHLQLTPDITTKYTIIELLLQILFNNSFVWTVASMLPWNVLIENLLWGECVYELDHWTGYENTSGASVQVQVTHTGHWSPGHYIVWNVCKVVKYVARYVVLTVWKLRLVIICYVLALGSNCDFNSCPCWLFWFRNIICWHQKPKHKYLQTISMLWCQDLPPC